MEGIEKKKEEEKKSILCCGGLLIVLHLLFSLSKYARVSFSLFFFVLFCVQSHLYWPRNLIGGSSSRSCSHFYRKLKPRV